MRVLYIEDNSNDIELVRHALDKQPAPAFEMTECHTLAEGREFLHNNTVFDVALVDLSLPDGDGMEFLTQAREMSLVQPILILTGSGDECRTVAALRAGAVDYVVKRNGFENTIVATLLAAVNRAQQEQSAGSRPINVLYCEHNEGDIDLTRRSLKKSAPHIRLRSCHSATEVLEILATPKGRANCDLLLLDYRLPGDSGLNILKSVRIERGYDIPVVIVTGQGDEEVAALTMRLGAADYVVKHPGYLDALPAVLQNAHSRAQLIREQTALRRKTDELDRFFSSTIDLLCVIDLEGRFERLNREWERSMGYSLDELEAQSVIDLVHPDDKAMTAEVLEKLGAGEEVENFANRCRCRDGTYRYIEWKAKQTDNLIYAAARDISGRIEAERAATAAESRLQQAVRAGNIGFWEWNVGSNDAYFSPEWKRQLGYADDEIPGRYQEWESRLHPEDRAHALEVIHDYINNPTDEFHHEYRLRHKDGSYRNIFARGSILNESGDASTRIIGTHIDLTDLKNLEKQIIQSQKMESIGRLAGGIAHDFNNLLSVINGYAQLTINALPEGDPICDDVKEIRSAGERAAALTSQLLAFSRKQVLQPAVVYPDALVQELTRMLGRLIGEDVKLQLKLEADDARIKIDPTQFEQVLINLAVNARDAMPQGGTLVVQSNEVDLDASFTELIRGVEPGRYFVLTVSDGGIGMSQDTQRQIFEPFFTTKGHGRGTGLGLSTVHGIVEQSRGHVFVYSEPGLGTTFKIYLPLVDEAAQPLRSRIPNTAARGTETILVVEDDENLLKLTERILIHNGYTVLPANSGAEAIELLIEYGDSVDMLLTDVIMPQLSGPDLVGHALHLRPGLNVLYMSGYSDEMLTRRGELNAAINLIAKPFTAAQLTQHIRRCFDSDECQPAAPAD